jgi:hypothetical protein
MLIDPAGFAFPTDTDPDPGQPNERGSKRIRIHRTGLYSQIPYLSFLSCLKGTVQRDGSFRK